MSLPYNSGTAPTTLCCQCGVPIIWNPQNLCTPCIALLVDIAEDIPKDGMVTWCRTCGRFLNPPNHWMAAALESKELLGLCLKRIRGLNKVRLVDARWIWTEPHSNRLKIELTIQKEMFQNAIVQKSFVVDFQIEPVQCEGCRHVASEQTWKALLQVRQAADHKRTFFLLEQLILKHNAHAHCTNIVEVADGMDFFYQNKSHALKMLDFVSSVLPVRNRGASEKLISADTKSATANVQMTYHAELAPVCKDDLICLPRKTAIAMGNFGPLVLCLQVTSQIKLICPQSLRLVDVPGKEYWKYPFASLCNSRSFVEFVVLDVAPEAACNGKFRFARAEIARCSDFGRNDITLQVVTHLGNIIKAGDICAGYDLTCAQFNDEALESYQGLQLPEVILVKKVYKKPTGRRTFKLKSLDAEMEGLAPQRAKDSKAKDYEDFLDDLVEDFEVRAKINLFKDPEGLAQAAAAKADKEGLMDGAENADDEAPEVNVDELLDDLAASLALD